MRIDKLFMKIASLVIVMCISAVILCSCGSGDIEVPLSSQYIFNSLTDKERPVFNRMYSGANNYKYSIRVGGMKEKEFSDLCMKFYSCGSEMFYISGVIKYRVSGSGNISECYFNYDYYTGSANNMREELSKKEDEILSGITDSMTDVEKIRYIHDYLIENITYDADALDCDNVYGALIKQRTHCQGFSKSVCCLCDKLGIESMLVTGNAGGPHMWNMVKVGGKWYNLDVTWDDPDFGGRKFDDYFLISDSTISMTHTKDNYIKYPDAPVDY